MIDTKFLEELGITDTDTIGKITSQYSQDIKAAGKVKNKAADDDRITELETQIADWKKKYGALEQSGKKELDALKFNHALSNALASSKAKNPKTVQALLDIEGLKLEDGKITGLDEQLEKIKSENDYLFENDKQQPMFAGKTSGGGASNLTKEAFEKMSYLDRVKLKKDTPEVYNSMTGKETE